MKRIAALWIILIAFQCSAKADGRIYVKVTEIEEADRLVHVFLPMHQTKLLTRAESEALPDRLELNQYYEAEIVPGKVETTRKSQLRVKLPKSKVLDLSILRISFQSSY